MAKLLKDKQLYDMPLNNIIVEAERFLECGKTNQALVCYQVAEEKSQDKSSEEKIALLLNLAMVSRLNARDELALSCYEKARALAAKINDRISLGKIHLKKGEIQERNGQWEEALKSYNNGCEIFTSLEEKKYLAENFFLIGKLFEKKHWYDTGLEWHKKSLKIRKECNDHMGMALVKIRLAAIYFSLGKKEEGTKYLKKCKEMAEGEEKLPEKTTEKVAAVIKKGDLYKEMASLYYYLGLWTESLKWFEKSYELYDRTGYVTKKIDTAISLSVIYLNKKKKEKSEELLNIAEKSSELIDENNIPHIYISLGWAFLRKGNLNKATKYLERAREIAEIKQNLYDLLEAIFALGKLYLFKGKWLKISILYDKVIEISQHQQSLRTLAIAYNNMGSLFTLQGETEKALKFLSLARDIFEKIEHYRGLADCYDNTAMVYENTAQDEWALYCLERALDIRKRINSGVGLSESFLKLAVYHTKRGRKNLAEEYFTKNLDIWKKAGADLEIELWNIQILYHYIKNNQKEEALKIIEDNKLEENLIYLDYWQGLRLLYKTRAYFYFTFKEMDRAEDYYQKVMTLSKEKGFINQLPDITGNLASFYEEKGEFDKALQYLEKKKILEENLGLKGGIINTYEALSRNYDHKAQTLKNKFSHQLPISPDIVSIPSIYPVMIEFGRELLPLINTNKDRAFYKRITSIRQHIAGELGVIVPEIKLEENLHLAPNEYVIKIKGVNIAKEKANLEKYLIVGAREDLEEFEEELCIEPASEMPAIWTDEKSLKKAEEKSCIILDAISAIVCNLTEILRSHIGSFLDRETLYLMLNEFAGRHPIIINEIYPEPFNLARIQKILKNLLKERVGIVDLKTILETLAEYGETTLNPVELTEYVRMALHRQICSYYSGEDNTINFIALDTNIEKIIGEAIHGSHHGSFLILPPHMGQKILFAIGKEVEEVKKKGVQPVILCSPGIRPYLRRLTERPFPKVPVIAHNELPYNCRVNIIATAAAAKDQS